MSDNPPTEEMIEVTREMMAWASTSPSGCGFVKSQIKLLKEQGINHKSNGWLKKMVGKRYPKSWFDRFCEAGGARRQSNYADAGVSISDGPVRYFEFLKKQSETKVFRKSSGVCMPPHPSEFKQSLPKTTFVESSLKKELFESEDWKFLRSYALRRGKYTCQHCRATGVRMHVDHKIPITVDWSRRLDLLNLQVLCEDCNVGKSNFFVG